jgi:uncharacterized protein YbjT (DUF2867 family)
MNDTTSHETSPQGAAPVLVTGASGYIGGRLVRLLASRGHVVRAMVRRPEALRAQLPAGIDVVAGDVMDRASLDAPLRGVGTAYYLVHSMGADAFEAADRLGARNFAEAARAAGITRIVYVGGLGSADEELSPHLRSRHEVGRLLREAGVPLVEFRASIVIGSGSLSYEMIRSLTERLPVMITPRWVHVMAQPIAIDDLLAYLVEALNLPPEAGRIFEIGGADRVSYADIMREYARQRRLPLKMLPVPVLTPYLSSLWLGLVTPLYARIGRKLIESIIHPTIVRDPSALAAFAVRPVGIAEAIRRALVREDREFAETRWSDALSSAGDPRTWGGVRFGTRLVDSRTIRVAASPAASFVPIESIGGDSGWYCCNLLWKVRGWLDILVGGVGLRRGRPHPTRLRIGETVDFWRVEALEPGRRLRLAAEMKVPGRAWLEFEVVPDGTGTTIRQTAIFDPLGWRGRLYWYSLFPLHEVVFAGMLRKIGVIAGG